MELISAYIDKGVTFVLALLVIAFLWTLIKNLPKWIENYSDAISHSAIATDNNTRVMSEVTTITGEVAKVIQNTEEMHKQMDKKMDTILKQIESLSEIIEVNERADEDFKKVIIKEINRLKEEFEELKKGGENN